MPSPLMVSTKLFVFIIALSPKSLQFDNNDTATILPVYAQTRPYCGVLQLSFL